MRVSREIVARFYELLVAKRDNTKGVLTEVEFYSYFYTIVRIQRAINEGKAVLEGMLIDDFELADPFKDILLPKEVRYENSSFYDNLIDNSDLEGHTSIVAEEGEEAILYSLVSDTYAYLCERQAMLEAAGEKKKAVFGKEASLLDPSKFSLVQEVIFKQATGKVPATTAISKLRTDENMILKLSDVMSSTKMRASFKDEMFTEDKANGIRPIQLKGDLLPFVNTNYAQFSATENFVTWFNKQLFSNSGK